MASTDSLAFVRAASIRARPLRVIGYGTRDAFEDILACAEAGASGYLLQDASVKELVTTTMDVFREDFVYPPMIVASLIKRVAASSKRPSAEASLLSPRELQIVACIAEGLSNKEIAQKLHIDVHTVKNHVHNILSKSHLHRRLEVAYLFGAPSGHRIQLMQQPKMGDNTSGQN
jgi:DNA-binding NarL/FixJ family response regulator